MVNPSTRRSINLGGGKHGLKQAMLNSKALKDGTLVFKDNREPKILECYDFLTLEKGMRANDNESRSRIASIANGLYITYRKQAEKRKKQGLHPLPLNTVFENAIYTLQQDLETNDISLCLDFMSAYQSSTVWADETETDRPIYNDMLALWEKNKRGNG